MTDENLEQILNAAIDLKDIKKLKNAIENKELTDPLGIENTIVSKFSKASIYACVFSDLLELEDDYTKSLQQVIEQLANLNEVHIVFERNIHGNAVVSKVFQNKETATNHAKKILKTAGYNENGIGYSDILSETVVTLNITHD